MSLILALLLSLALNVLLVWYLKKVLFKLLFISDNIDNLLTTMQDFTAHVERVNGMETYYGDEVLQGLVNHSKDIVEAIEEYEGVYTITRYIKDEEEEYAEEEG